MLDLPVQDAQAPVTRSRGSHSVLALVGVVQVLVAAVLDIWAIFPNQGGGMGPMSANPNQVVSQAMLAAGLVLAAALILAPPIRATVAGGAIAAGIAGASLGLLIDGVAQTLSRNPLGAGTLLAILAWAASALGAAATLAAPEARPIGRPGSLRTGREIALGVTTAVAALALGVAFLPNWDHLSYTSAVASGSEGAGSAFGHLVPTWSTVGDLVAAVAFAAIPVIAVAWRPARIGVMFTAGLLVVVAAQLVSAVVQASFLTAATFGMSTAEARAIDLTGQMTLTAWFDISVLAALVLLVLLVARWWTPAGSLGASPAPDPWRGGSGLDGWTFPPLGGWVAPHGSTGSRHGAAGGGDGTAGGSGPGLQPRREQDDLSIWGPGALQPGGQDDLSIWAPGAEPGYDDTPPPGSGPAPEG